MNKKTMLLEVAALSAALRVSDRTVMRSFLDGRVVSAWTEEWASALFGFDRSPSSNQAFSDGGRELGELGSVQVQVKTLTRGGVKFQQSKYIGSGRNCTQANLEASIEGVDKYCIVDVVEFPLLSFYLIDSKVLLREALLGNITCRGMTRNTFLKIFDTETPST